MADIRYLGCLKSNPVMVHKTCRYQQPVYSIPSSPAGRQIMISNINSAFSSWMSRAHMRLNTMRQTRPSCGSGVHHARRVPHRHDIVPVKAGSGANLSAANLLCLITNAIKFILLNFLQVQLNL